LLFPLITTFARGGSIVAWQEDDGRLSALRARRVHRDGTLGRRLTLAKRAVPFSDEWEWIATGRAGATVAVWEDPEDVEGGGIRARRLSRRGKLGPVHRIAASTLGGLDAAVAVDADGNATIAWSRVFHPSSQDTEPLPPTTVHVRRLTAKGELGRTVTLRLGDGFNDHPRVAVAASGRTTVAWGFCCATSSIGATTIGSNGKIAPVRDISSGAGGSEPELAMDARGNAVVVWAGRDLMARRIYAGGALGPLQVLGSGQWADSDPRVAFDRAGNASVLWRHTDTIQFRRISADGTLGPVTNLSGPPGPHVPGVGQVFSPALAVDPAGNATVAWSKATRHPDPSGATALQVRSVAPTGELGAIRTLASSPVGLSRPKIVADKRGVVTVAWSEFSRHHDKATIRVARLVGR
jgi:hypothetical protein